MAPTICTEKEARVRDIRESRKRFQTSSSVISYAGKITHRRSVAIRTATSKFTALRSLESDSTEESDSKSDQEVPYSTESGRIADDITEETGGRKSQSLQNILGTSHPSKITPAKLNCRCSNRNGDLVIGIPTAATISTTTTTTTRTTTIRENCDQCGCFYTTNGVIVRIDQQLIKGDESSNSTAWSDDVDIYDDQSSNSTIGNHQNSRLTSKYHVQQPPQQNTKGLLDIAVKTIKLIKRNQLLQKKLAQLQFETRAFIESVLANPENQAIREKIEKSKQIET